MWTLSSKVYISLDFKYSMKIKTKYIMPILIITRLNTQNNNLIIKMIRMTRIRYPTIS